MTLVEKVKFLHQKFGGKPFESYYKQKFLWFNYWSSKGWFDIDENEDNYSIMLTSGKTTHQPLYGPAYSIDIQKSDGLRPNHLEKWGYTGVCKSAITMHAVRNKDEIEEIWNYMCNLIEETYNHEVQEL